MTPTPQNKQNGLARSPETDKLEREINQTREHMAATLEALGDKVNPAELKAVVREELEAAKSFVKEEVNEVELKIKRGLSEAKETVKEELKVAKENVKEELKEAKENVKEEIKEAYDGLKKNVRAATIGKVEDLATTLGDKMNETRETLMDTIRANPVPAALMGVGVAWLLMNRSRDAAARRRGDFGGGGYGPRPQGPAVGQMFNDVAHAASTGLHRATAAVSNVAHNAAHSASDLAGRVAGATSEAASTIKDKASEAASTIAEGASHAASTIKETASHAASAVSHGATDAAHFVADNAKKAVKSAGHAYETTLNENPLVLGGAALTLGALVGVALPRTPVEDEVLGPARDRMLKRAGEVAHDAAESIVHLTEQSAEGVKKVLSPGAEKRSS